MEPRHGQKALLCDIEYSLIVLCKLLYGSTNRTQPVKYEFLIRQATEHFNAVKSGNTQSYSLGV